MEMDARKLTPLMPGIQPSLSETGIIKAQIFKGYLFNSLLDLSANLMHVYASYVASLIML
jgi:hypothetical protein